MTSLVLSIIDYWKILLSDLPAYKIRPLDRIIRSAVLVVYNIPHCEKTNDISIKQLMKKLKWLSVNDRINYKICISINLAIHHNSLSYLSDCVNIVQQLCPSPHLENTITVRYLPCSASSIFRRCWICDMELATVIASSY